MIVILVLLDAGRCKLGFCLIHGRLEGLNSTQARFWHMPRFGEDERFSRVRAQPPGKRSGLGSKTRGSELKSGVRTFFGQPLEHSCLDIVSLGHAGSG